MPPQDFQAVIAKILFFVFATCLLCLGRVQGHELQETKQISQSVNYGQIR